MFLVSKKYFEKFEKIIKNYESQLDKKDRIIFSQDARIDDLNQERIDATMHHTQEIDLIYKKVEADKKRSKSLANTNSKARVREKTKMSRELNDLKSKLTARDNLVSELVSEVKNLNNKIDLLEKANSEYCNQIAAAKTRISYMTDYLKNKNDSFKNGDTRPTLEDVKLYSGPKVENEKYVGVSKKNGKKV